MIILEYENNKNICDTGCNGSWELTKFRIKQKKVQISAETNTLCDDFTVNPYDGDMRNFAPFFSILSPIPLF